MKRQINICVAVATKLGLLTPVIHDAGRKNLLTIAEDLNDLAERGREGRLAARDFEGGTFTVTNSGVYGSVLFTPIINHPQSAVLGLGRIAMTPVVRDEAIVPALMMYMSLTYNHRSIDGETAVRFLQRIRFYLEHPDKMLELNKASA
jgi:Pyruvate/2-oxoglutarate dehydrogenase complex, dihydrolipoamide acyltransferase (E2) component, and related enzymes